MSQDIDNEVEAIRTILTALEPLSPDVQSSVVNYVLGRLGVQLANSHRPTDAMPAPRNEAVEPVKAATSAMPPVGHESVHIKDFKEEKKPRSATEMTAIVAYYLENLAEEKERKSEIKSSDLETYFKIAEFPLPKEMQFTLPNAKKAGYMDAVGNGEYRLNAVGHNLVVHSMPKTGSSSAPKRRKAKPKSAGKPTASKKK